MKTSFPHPLLAMVMMLLVVPTGSARAQSPILPKGWITADQLEQAQVPLQKQLDTGVDMTGTAWDMAAVKDAEMLVLYISLFEKLPESKRAAFLQEQEAWLQRRTKASLKSGDAESGQLRHLASAAEQQSWTEKRIAELKKRLAKQ